MSCAGALGHGVLGVGDTGTNPCGCRARWGLLGRQMLLLLPLGGMRGGHASAPCWTPGCPCSPRSAQAARLGPGAGPSVSARPVSLPPRLVPPGDAGSEGEAGEEAAVCHRPLSRKACPRGYVWSQGTPDSSGSGTDAHAGLLPGLPVLGNGSWGMNSIVVLCVA